MRVHEDFTISGQNQITDVSFTEPDFELNTKLDFEGVEGKFIAVPSKDLNVFQRTVQYGAEVMRSGDPTVLQKMIRFAVNGVVKTREQVLRFGNFAIPLIVAYNAGKVFLATQYGEPVMDLLNLDAETQKTFMESSVPIVLGTSKTLYAGIWITAEKVRDTLKERGGPSIVLNEFISDERS